MRYAEFYVQTTTSLNWMELQIPGLSKILQIFFASSSADDFMRTL